MGAIIEQFSAVLWNVINRPSVVDLIDILLLTVIIYEMLLHMRHTRISQTIKGIVILLLATWADSAAYVGSGDIVALCVLGTERNEVIGDVPSSAEVGVPIELGYSRMFTCLKGTPQEAADAFEAAVHRACKQAGWEKWLAENGFSNNYLWDHTETGEALKAFYTLGQELLNK